jgi:hypothetical protein
MGASHADGFKGDRLSALVGISTTIIGALIGYYWNPLVAVALFLALPAFHYLLSDGLERVSASGDEPRVSA